MDINYSPILTTRNYGINSAKVDASVFCDKVFPFKNVNIENGDRFLVKNKNDEKLLCMIGEEFDKQLRKNENVNLKFCVDENPKETIFIKFDFDQKNSTLVENVNFEIEKNVQANIVVTFEGNCKSYHNGQLQFDCGENSCVNVVVVCDMTENSLNFLRFGGSVEKNAKLDLTIVDFGGQSDIHRFYAKLSGESAVSNLNSLYVASGKSFVDLNYEQDVFGKTCKADIQTIGALFGDARKHFKGTINFEKGCKKSVGCEDELCLMLSKNAKSKALPMLLCTEEDVEGKHSSSVGKVDDKQLFYVMSRGFSFSEAQKLIVQAKFDCILKNIFNEKLRKELVEKIDRKLSYEEI